MKPVFFSPEAEDDLKDAWDYIAWFDADAADRLLERVSQARSRLCEQPMSGRARTDLAIGLRSVLVTPYLLLHRVMPDAVEVVRIIHASRDIPIVLSD